MVSEIRNNGVYTMKLDNQRQSSLLSTLQPIADEEPIKEIELIVMEDEEDGFEDGYSSRNIEKYFVNVNVTQTVIVEACYNKLAPWFVLAHTFVYMLTYYGITPTTYDYNFIMGIPKPLFGLVSAFTPFIAAISCFIYNWQTDHHFKKSYMISLGCLASGAFLYTLALTYRSIVILFIGRGLFGYGGARILTRKFFAKYIHI